MLAVLAVAMTLNATSAAGPTAPKTAEVTLSGKAQTVVLYPTAKPASALVVLSSGDLGWMGFVVNIAQYLQSQNVAVLGLNSRAYLSSFTNEKGALDPKQIPRDFDVLVHEAQRRLATSQHPVLAGVSEGAGLSLVAAADVRLQRQASGVLTLGLPASIELGWRAWRDWTIWITKGEPDEPHLSMAPFVGQVSPLPIALIQSTHDEFVSPADAQAVYGEAREPKRRYLIDARNHRFSNRQTEVHRRLLEALTWITTGHD